MRKILIVVDMQNDFITGSLANADAEAIVKPICEYIKNFHGHIIATRDTHRENYLNSKEGKYLPVKHCIHGTPGWCINDDIYKAIISNESEHTYNMIDKYTFGYNNWKTWIDETEVDEIILVGTCTSICVAANATILKALFPEIEITVIADLCADINKESHQAALAVMKNQQINIK